ncbi:hypothetical protein EVAR_16001_1 [Eumeta japonica]|uniref:Uncharacterized protein n=1 Tax=Eumeta variegata TaxID=151549 RepID=A0A4C1UL90_EUMVA|nr:hypothetical protein EVAR_16001_1 [Eumeta japonica]
MFTLDQLSQSMRYIEWAQNPQLILDQLRGLGTSFSTATAVSRISAASVVPISDTGSRATEAPNHIALWRRTVLAGSVLFEGWSECPSRHGPSAFRIELDRPKNYHFHPLEPVRPVKGHSNECPRVARSPNTVLVFASTPSKACEVLEPRAVFSGQDSRIDRSSGRVAGYHPGRFPL